MIITFFMPNLVHNGNSLIAVHRVEVINLVFDDIDDPVMLFVEGNAELIGPSVIGLSGGRGGTYIKSIGKAGTAKLIVSDVNGKATADVEFKIQLEP